MANPNPTPPPEETRWKPGESGNPAGMPKGTVHIKTIAKRIFAEMDTWDRLPDNVKKFKEVVGNDKNYGEALLYAWMAKALSDPRFAAIVLELTDGKGKTEVDVNDKRQEILDKYLGGEDGGQADDSVEGSSENTA